jgi:hypothetical protein
VYIGITANDLTIRGFQEIPETDAEPNILDYFVGILSVYVVLNCLCAWLVEIVG